MIEEALPKKQIETEVERGKKAFRKNEMTEKGWGGLSKIM